MKPDRTSRPRPLLEGIRWLVSPLVNWWTFAGTIPALVYAAFAMGGLLLLLQFVRLFVRK